MSKGRAVSPSVNFLGSCEHLHTEIILKPGLPFPSPGDLSDPGIKPASPALQADSLPTEPSGKPGFVHLGPRAMLY